MLPEDNELEIETSIISEEEFALAASPADLKGRINLRTELALQTEIEDIAEDSRYPLRSVSEVVRYCCLVGIERLRQWQPAQTLLGNIKAANALVLRDKIQCETLDLLTRMDERVVWYVEHEYYDEAIDFIAKMRTYFDGFNGDFWAGRIQAEIDTNFIKWLDMIDRKRDESGMDQA